MNENNNNTEKEIKTPVDFDARAQELRDRRRNECDQTQELNEREEWRQWRAELDGFAIDDARSARELLDRWVARPGYRGRDIRDKAARAIIIGYISALFVCDTDLVVNDLEDYGEIPDSMPIMRSIVTECADCVCDAIRCRLIADIDSSIVSILDEEYCSDVKPASSDQNDWSFAYSFPQPRHVPDINDKQEITRLINQITTKACTIEECNTTDSIDHATLIEESLGCISLCETLLRAFPVDDVKRTRFKVICDNTAADCQQSAH